MKYSLLILLITCSVQLGGCSPDNTSDTKQQAENVTPTKQKTSSRPEFKITQAVAEDIETTNLACTIFEDVHQEAGIDFVYDRGVSGKSLMVEATGGGVAWIDFDRDGLFDLYCVQGGNPIAGKDEKRPENRLFRNIGNGQFTDVTPWTETASGMYGQGVSAGDYDNDGFTDFVVTNVGTNDLYHNQGDGTFEHVTSTRITQDQLWSSSAAWGDLNRDGLLDLFVCNYLDYDPYDPVICTDATGKSGTCHPRHVDPVENSCFINQGNGQFEEITKSAGLTGPGSKSLGVVIADMNADGWQDIYVANDTTGNFLFINQHDGTFIESALAMGCSRNGAGSFEASMGVAFGDYDQDGRPDLYCTHFTIESNTLFRNLGPAGFADMTVPTRIQKPTEPYLGFGTIMADFNRDGHQEIFVTNGHIDDWRDRGELLEMPPQLFQFDGKFWQECSEQSGRIFQKNFLGRGVASCDYDDDGDLDLAVVHQGAPLALLQNQSEQGHYLKVGLQGIRNNRLGIGAKVKFSINNQSQTQQLVGGSSYCSSHQPILLFTTPNHAPTCQLEITWPDGFVQTVAEVPLDQTVTVIEDASSR